MALTSLLMEVYGDLANPLAPDDSLAREIPLVPMEMQTGRQYYVPVHMGLELGLTFNTDHTAFALNPVVDADYQAATIQGAEILNRVRLSYGDMTRLSKSKGKSSKAYDQGVAVKIANMMQGAELVREAQLLYGAGTTRLANLGVINSVPVAASGGVVTVSITAASFAPGFWWMAKGLKIDVYNGATKRNTTTAIQVSANGALNQCRLTLTGLQSEIANIVAGDVIYLYNAATTSMVGIQPILENTGALFGIDASTYAQWKAVQYSVGGTLTFDKVMEALSQAANANLTEGITLFTTNQAWTDLMNDEVALRRYTDDAKKEATPGFEKLTFTHAVGTVTIRAHKYLKQGLALGLPTKKWKRVGSQDISGNAPGNPDEWFATQVADSAALELRAYSDQAIFCSDPATSIIFSNISSSGDFSPS